MMADNSKISADSLDQLLLSLMDFPEMLPIIQYFFAMTVENLASGLDTPKIPQKVSHCSLLAANRLLALAATWIFQDMEQ